jgi:hypothetical protein
MHHRAILSLSFLLTGCVVDPAGVPAVGPASLDVQLGDDDGFNVGSAVLLKTGSYSGTKTRIRATNLPDYCRRHVQMMDSMEDVHDDYGEAVASGTGSCRALDALYDGMAAAWWPFEGENLRILDIEPLDGVELSPDPGVWSGATWDADGLIDGGDVLISLGDLGASYYDAMAAAFQCLDDETQDAAAWERGQAELQPHQEWAWTRVWGGEFEFSGVPEEPLRGSVVGLLDGSGGPEVHADFAVEECRIDG